MSTPADPKESETTAMPEKPGYGDRGGEERRSGFLKRLGARMRSRSEEAELRGFYREYGGEIFGLAYRSLGDRGLAEEIVQETFVRAWRSREKFDEGRGSRRTWLFAIARNLITDSVRARRSRPKLASPGAQERTERSFGEDPTERVAREMVLWEAVGRLREEHRLVVTEVHYRGRPYAELSEELGVPVGTLRSRAYYALKSLRLVLEEMESPGERS